MKKKHFYISFLFAATCLLSLFLCRPTSTKQLQHALDLLQQGQYRSCREQLQKINPKKIATTPALYQGYLLLIQKEYTRADKIFDQAAFEILQDKKPQGGLLEILTAKALCHYLQGDFEGFCTYLEQAGGHGESEWLTFANGLQAYCRQDFAKAAHLWQQIDSHSEASGWQDHILGKLFSPTWKKIHCAHLCIEENDFLIAREILEQETLKVETQESHLDTTAFLFLGLSYLKEADSLAYEARLNLYKMAHFYFERAQITRAFEQEKNYLIAQLTERAMQLCENEAVLQPLLPYLIFPLQKWEIHTSLELVADKTAFTLLQQKGTSGRKLCHMVKTHFEGALFYQLLHGRLLKRVSHSIKEGNHDQLTEIWTVLCHLGQNSEQLAQQITYWTIEELESSLVRDTQELRNTRSHLEFLKDLGEEPNKITHLSMKLLEYSKSLWREGGEEVKATHLMQLALELSDHRQGAAHEIESFLTDLYAQAEKSNLVSRLSYIYDALCNFNLHTHALFSPATLANHLADANYRFNNHNFSSCKTLASWVLRLDPNNQNALRLCGLADYHLGNYLEAIVYLKQLNTFDALSHKALVLSEALTSQEQAHLVHMDDSDSFVDQE